MELKVKSILPFTILFIVLTLLIFLINPFLLTHSINMNVLVIANALFFMLAIATLFIQLKAMGNKNPNVFIRSIMGTLMIKMFTCLIVVMAYRFLFPQSFSAGSVFVSMIMYLLYLATEVKVILGLNKKMNA